MCGIAGIVGENAVEHRDALQRMMSALIQRGPDGEGMYESPSGLCLFGHKRLAIIDLSDSATQPMKSSDGRYALCYNGECYNFADLRNRLKRQGDRFRSSGDTEVVMKMLKSNGKSCLSQLNSMFAFGFWDEHYQKLLLARDRFGQKPLYYCVRGKLLLFASEVRALLTSGLIERNLNLNALRSYLAYGAVHGPDTIVAGISLLSASSYLEWAENSDLEVKRYWSPGREKKRCDSQELCGIFEQAVERHLVSDVPIGAFLSGGVDSSAVVSAAVRATDKEVTSLSVVFPDAPEISEHVYAKRMASFAGTNHFEVSLTDNSMIALLPCCLNAMDQPTIDSFNTFVVSHAARENGLKVVLSGLGGDELFGGYPSFHDIPKWIRFKRGIRRFDKSIAALLSSTGLLTKKWSKLVSLLAASGDALSLYLIRRQVFSNNQIGNLIPEVRCDQASVNLPEEFEEYLRNIMVEREIHDVIGLFEMFSYMGQTLLRDVDVAGMAHSLEIRMPFLDTEFINTALALPSKARTPSGVPKKWFVQAMNGRLPLKNMKRPKQGFVLPFSSWMRLRLRADIEDGLSTLSKHCNLFDPFVIEAFWQRFLKNPESVGWSRLWSLYVLGQYIHKNRLTV